MKLIKYALIGILALQIIQAVASVGTMQKIENTLTEIKTDLKIIKITQSEGDQQKKADEIEVLEEYGEELKDMKQAQ